MSKIKATYENNLRTHCEHDNGATLITDGPKQLQGLEEYFSPTDLFATSLATCMLTFLGIAAKKLNIDLSGTTATVEKEMTQTPPRRIAKLTVIITSKFNPTIEQKTILETTATNCPVHLSLHPDIKQEITFKWNV